MKNLAIVTLLVLVMASSVFAQAISGGQAREAAMGGSQAGTGLVLNPFIMNDPSLMFINPAYQANYHDYGWSNIAGGNIAGTTNTAQDGYGLQSAGIAFSLNSDWNIGAILSYDPSAANGVSQLIGFSGIVQRENGPQNIPAIQNAWEVVASTHMSSMSLGFGLMYGSSNSDATTSNVTPASSTSSEASSHVWGFRAGIIDDLGNGNAFDASAALRLDKATDNVDGTPAANNQGDYSASATEFQINARGKFKVSSKFNFVPLGNFSTVSATPQEDAPPNGVKATTLSRSVKFTQYGLGVGGEYRSQGVYIAGGLSWVSGQVEIDRSNSAVANSSTTDTYKYSALPVVNLGAEWSFLDWLVGRVGYFRYNGNVNVKTQDASGTSETNNTAGQYVLGNFIPGVMSNMVLGNLNPNTWDGVVTLGVGFKFGGWAMDATVSDEALRRGLGLIGGGTDNINTFGYITASYNFSE